MADIDIDLPGDLGDIASSEIATSAEWWNDPWPEQEHFRNMPLLPDEAKIHGAAAERCPETGFIWERGSGSASKVQQTAACKRNLCNRDWCIAYLRTDPHAGYRHPGLHKHYERFLKS
jgi:hypothetical protein